MRWFLIALLTPVLHSISNLIDKILLEKAFTKLNLFVFMIYAALTTICFLPIFAIFGGTFIFQINLRDIAILVVAGFFEAAAIYFYLLALNREEASVVVPFFQLIPIASYAFSYILLGETLSRWQFAGALIIILGASILSFEFDQGRKIQFRRYVVAAMTAMAILMALAGVLFKFAAINENFWISNFWESGGFASLGVIIFFSRKQDRDSFFQSIRASKYRIVGGVLLSELFTSAGNVALNFAFLLVPVALARSIEGYQPVCILIFGLFLTKCFPHILKEKTGWKHLAPKMFAILIIFVGSYLVLI